MNTFSVILYVSQIVYFFFPIFTVCFMAYINFCVVKDSNLSEELILLESLTPQPQWHIHIGSTALQRVWENDTSVVCKQRSLR